MRKIEKLWPNIFWKEVNMAGGKVKVANVESNTSVISQKDFNYIYEYLRKWENKFKGDCYILEINWIH